MSGPIFTSGEIAQAERRLEVAARRKINKAFRFHNALEAMLADVARSQLESPPTKLLALDATEVIAAVDYNEPLFSAFTFGGLLTERGSANPARAGELELMDRLITAYVIGRRAEPFMLTDAHADELAIVRQALSKRSQSTLLLLNEYPIDRFEGFQKAQLDRIRQYIIGTGKRQDIEDEFKRFQHRFLPHWRRDFVDLYFSQSRSLHSIDEFVRNANYVFLRPASFGLRSILRALSYFRWDEFDAYVRSDEAVANYTEIKDTVASLCGKIVRRNRSSTLVDAAARRDGEALATIHLLNVFLSAQQMNTRVELVSRSPTLHDVLSALPPGKIRATIRHPLLMPDIYKFSPGALSAIGDVANKVHAVIQPYLDAADEIGGNAREEIDLLEVAKSASAIVPLLRDVISIQEGVEGGDGVIRQVYAMGSYDRNSVNGVDIAADIHSLFDLLADRLEMRDDPFTHVAFRQLIDRNKKAARFEWERVFERDEKISCRILPIDDSDISPEPFVAIRLVDGSFTRLFHIHSRTLIKDILSKTHSDKRSSKREGKELQPFTIDLTAVDVLSQLDKSLDRLSNREMLASGGGDDERYSIDATLIVAMALASKNRISTAISVSSTVLHDLTDRLRQGDGAIEKRSVGQLLAFRELLILRYYCERKIAIDEFFAEPKSLSYVRGGVERSMARAQRDIDFAAHVSELIERKSLSANSIPDDPTPAGYRTLNDYRLRLAHMSGWMDMFLMTARASADGHERQSPTSVPDAIALRRDIWTAVGLVKEALYDAHEVGGFAMAAGRPSEHRYYRNLEVRILQNVLATFALLLASKDVPGLHTLLDGSASILPERVLAFRDWAKWWARYDDLTKKYRFQLRLFPMIKTVCEAVASIEQVRRDHSQDAEKRRERSEGIRRKLENDLTLISSKPSGQFVSQLSRLMCSRLRTYGL